jgi:fatty-acyl-CoA synthase
LKAGGQCGHARPSYCHGTSDTPLLGDTIGVNFERTVARFADRPGLRRHQEVR